MPVPSQVLNVKLDDIPFTIDLDSGATVAFIRKDIASKLNLDIKANGQLARLADMKTRMKSLGEIDTTVVETSTQHVLLRLRALVVEELGVECYGGQTFHLDNGIVDNVSLRTISIHHGRYTIKQAADHLAIAYPPKFLSITERDAYLGAATTCTPHHPPPVQDRDERCAWADTRTKPSQQWSNGECQLSRSKTIAIKRPRYLLPSGEYEIDLGQHPDNNNILIMPEPPIINQTSQVESTPWPPQICQVSGGNAQYINFSSDKPLHHPGNVHFRAIQVEELPFDQALAAADGQQCHPSPSLGSASHSTPNDVLPNLKINRSIMSPAQSQRFDNMILQNIRAFEEDLSGGYDNEDDPYEATFSFKRENMAPPVKVWVPQFN